jgi:hypothetical protein
MKRVLSLLIFFQRKMLKTAFWYQHLAGAADWLRRIIQIAWVILMLETLPV